MDDEASTVFSDASPLAEDEPQGIKMVEDAREDDLKRLRGHKFIFLPVKAMMPTK